MSGLGAVEALGSLIDDVNTLLKLDPCIRRFPHVLEELPGLLDQLGRRVVVDHRLIRTTRTIEIGKMFLADEGDHELRLISHITLGERGQNPLVVSHGAGHVALLLAQDGQLHEGLRNARICWMLTHEGIEKTDCFIACRRITRRLTGSLQSDGQLGIWFGSGAANTQDQRHGTHTTKGPKTHVRTSHTDSLHYLQVMMAG